MFSLAPERLPFHINGTQALECEKSEVSYSLYGEQGSPTEVIMFLAFLHFERLTIHVTSTWIQYLSFLVTMACVNAVHKIPSL